METGRRHCVELQSLAEARSNPWAESPELCRAQAIFNPDRKTNHDYACV